MTRRLYVRKVGSVSIGSAGVDAFIMIRTDDDRRAAAEGFTPVPDNLSEEAAMRSFGVTVIYDVNDDGPVN